MGSTLIHPELGFDPPNEAAMPDPLFHKKQVAADFNDVLNGSRHAEADANRRLAHFIAPRGIKRRMVEATPNCKLTR